ncbi:MAG: substrate-binding domain-containing protein [Pseudomonadota bacterium]
MSQTRFIRALVPIALKDVFDQLVPSFEAETGYRVDQVHALNPEMPKLIESGIAWDIVLSNPPYIERIVAAGSAKRMSHKAFARTPLAFGALGPSAKPVATTVSDISQLLLASKTVAITEHGTSGGTFATLGEKLGISSQLKSRVVPLEGGGPMRTLLAGDVELAALPLTNIAPVDGVSVVGICPIGWDVHIDLSVCLNNDAEKAASVLADWLLSSERDQALAKLGAKRLAP